MTQYFDERLGYLDEGDEVKLETRNGNTYSIVVDSVETGYSEDGRLDYVGIEAQESSKQLFTYRRKHSNPQEVSGFQPTYVVNYELEDSWQRNIATEEALDNVADLFGWNESREEELLVPND